ncbi:hypothetical protein OC835_006456 [Tilletia horrida]|nr:hypothetical protein OC835_006456 [Tilletia horrida]
MLGMVHHVLGYLCRERVDLLSISLVCKALCAHALQIWAPISTSPSTAAADRLELFKAHPRLLSHVRFLRVRNDLQDVGIWGVSVDAIRIAGKTDLRPYINQLLSNLHTGQVLVGIVQQALSFRTFHYGKEESPVYLMNEEAHQELWQALVDLVPTSLESAKAHLSATRACKAMGELQDLLNHTNLLSLTEMVVNLGSF